MAEREDPAPDPPEFVGMNLQTFLTQHIRDHSRLRHGAIIQAALNAFDVSRSTVARHLSRLVRFGEVTLLPDRTYAIAEPATSASRAVLEVRWIDHAVVIDPNGSARFFAQEEFRVVSGQLDHLELTNARTYRVFSWWCTAPARMVRVAAKYSRKRQVIHRLEFATPLTARNPAWQQNCLTVVFPRW